MRQTGRPASQGDASGRQLRMGEFTSTLEEAFGLSKQQSTHFFRLMDFNGDGSISMQEWTEALSRCPHALLITDLRSRLLSKFQTIDAALHAAAIQGNLSLPLSRHGLTSALCRVCPGICSAEVDGIFGAVNDGRTADVVTLRELQDTLREKAPWSSLEDFFKRLWLSAKSFDPAQLLVSREDLADLHPNSGLTRNVFDRLCISLDIPKKNGKQIWAAIFHNEASATWEGLQQRAELFMPSTDAERLRWAMLQRFGSVRGALDAVHDRLLDGRAANASVDLYATPVDEKRLEQCLKSLHVDFSGSCCDILSEIATARAGKDRRSCSPSCVTWGSLQSYLESEADTGQPDESIPSESGLTCHRARSPRAEGAVSSPVRRRRAKSFVRSQYAPLRRQLQLLKKDLRPEHLAGAKRDL